MATINKTMKTFNVPNGADTICYEIVDEAGRKCLAKDWATHSDEAFAAGEYVFKDGKFYKFKTNHTEGNTWSSSEVEETNLGDEITGLKSAIGTVPEGKNLQGEVDELQTVKADKDGEYEDLTAGNALYLLSDRGDTDVAPYVFRKTGGAKNGYGREFLRKIVGGTVAWNQLVQNGNFANTTGWYVTGGSGLSASNNIASFTATTTGENNTQLLHDAGFTTNHKVLVCADIKCSESTYSRIRNPFISTAVSIASNVWTSIKAIGIVDDSYKGYISIQFNGVANATFEARNIVAFDLTQMFGSTIADAIYAMEQATAGSGVAWFRSLFPNSYYAYDAGSLQSVQAKEHRLTGFNQWDEQWELGGLIWMSGQTTNATDRIRSKSFSKCLPNTVYYATKRLAFFFYDANKEFISYAYNDSTTKPITTPANACYFKVLIESTTEYSGDICINISNSALNGTYKPYESHTYPLDSSLVLRGIPKWDSTNGLYYDGDEYTPDGSVKRKYGEIILDGTETWYFVSAGSYNYFYADTAYNVTAWQSNDIISDFLGTSMTGDDTSSKYYTQFDGNKCIRIVTTEYTTIPEFKAFLASRYSAGTPVRIVYKLATPTTEQADDYRELQISAHGGTEEFIDAGVTASTPTRDVSIPAGTETFYPIDVVAYIEELTNPDHDMVADALIPSGKYFMVGNSLYKSTSQIQAGDTIIPGSNCTAKNLAEALNELNA